MSFSPNRFITDVKNVFNKMRSSFEIIIVANLKYCSSFQMFQLPKRPTSKSSKRKRNIFSFFSSFLLSCFLSFFLFTFHLFLVCLFSLLSDFPIFCWTFANLESLTFPFRMHVSLNTTDTVKNSTFKKMLFIDFD